jgi:DNA-binding transcriptional regulator YiaG
MRVHLVFLSEQKLSLTQIRRLRRQRRRRVMSERKLSPAQIFFSRLQVAVMLDVSTETIKRWERAGVLKSVRFNSRVVRYRREDVERMIGIAS